MPPTINMLDPSPSKILPVGDAAARLFVDLTRSPRRRRRRFCRCERDLPYAVVNWDIGPDGGNCRSCGRELHPGVVRREHAHAIAERRRVLVKLWSPGWRPHGSRLA